MSDLESSEALLIRIDENVKHLRNEAIPEIKGWQESHDQSDNTRFANISTKLDTATGVVRTLRWVIGGLGVILAAVVTAFVQHVLSGK